MNDELLLSLYLDGCLDDDAEFEARLQREPELRARYDAMLRLQEMSEQLEFTPGSFSADDVRVRLGQTPRRRFGPIIAAAVVALALTHLGTFHLGRRGADTPGDPLLETEVLLARASRLNADAPHERLQDELGTLRRDIHMASLPRRLEPLAEGDVSAPDTQRAVRLVDALAQLELVFEEFEDPGFRVLMVTNIARASLFGQAEFRILPATANSYSHVIPMGGGRFRVRMLRPGGERFEDEGTIDELRARHVDVRFIEGVK